MMFSGFARITALACAAALLATAQGCGGDAVTALEEPVERVYTVETNAQALQAWAAAGADADVLVHIDASEDMRVFPPSLAETMRNAADHLERGNAAVVDRVASILESGGTVNLGLDAGFYDRVAWVVPSPEPVSETPLSNFRRVLIEKRGYTPQALSELAAEGRAITGTIAGVPVTVTSLEDLEAGEEIAVLDIDLTWFVGLQSRDPDHRPGTGAVLDFLRALKRKRIKVETVTINAASTGGVVPMDIRFYAEVIRDALVRPGILDGGLPALYVKMIEAEEALVRGEYSAAEGIYEELVAGHGDRAGLWFSLAVSRGFQGKGEESREALLEAYSLDGAYMRGFFQLARVLGSSGQVEAGRALLETPDLAKIIPEEELDYQKGVFFFAAGDYFEAVDYLEAVARRRPDDFALRTIIFRAYEEIGDDMKMSSTLEALLRLDAGRVDRDMPWVYKRLGDLVAARDLSARAAELYEHYIELYPEDEEAERLKEYIERWGSPGR